MKLQKLDKDLDPAASPQPNCDTRRLVCDEAYPGTVVTIGLQSFHVNQLEHHCTFGLRNGFVCRI